MAQEAQARVQKAVNSMVEELDKSCLRKMQGDMHRCAASCCDKTGMNIDEVHRCIETCSEKMNKAQNYVQNELSNYQDRIQRCVMQCQDAIRDNVTPETTEAEVQKYRDQFESCVVKCAETHVDMVPGILKRMKNMLEKGSS
ncbi:protein FAM136A-like [Limulus polyphemus]|uniref:Protein FAM136A-like n=1 Tax=Limulus polyphemus TaxID=6850 RepID=A0ABM1B927_LIMPO|nr:protein FAM136A-like [Limulus polyphemus]